MSESTKSTAIPPYIPFDTFTGFLEFLKGSAVPSRIDKSAMPSDLAPLVRGQVQSALRFLKLIDAAGVPDPKLRQLVAAYGTEKWKDALRDVLSDAYVELVGDIDLDSATQHQLDERFGEFYDSEQMRIKAARFYTTAMTAAGMKFSPHLMARRMSPTPRNRSVNKTQKPAASTSTKLNRTQDVEVQDGEICFPLGPGRVIKIPKDLTVDDCKMIKTMLPVFEAYAARVNGGEGGDNG